MKLFTFILSLSALLLMSGCGGESGSTSNIGTPSSNTEKLVKVNNDSNATHSTVSLSLPAVPQIPSD